VSVGIHHLSFIVPVCSASTLLLLCSSPSLRSRTRARVSLPACPFGVSLLPRRFAILNDELNSQLRCSRSTSLGSGVYLALLLLYLLVACFSLAQLTRALLALSFMAHWMVCIEHILILCISVGRAINMLVF
jgi:hypothetical protein